LAFVRVQHGVGPACVLRRVVGKHVLEPGVEGVAGLVFVGDRRGGIADRGDIAVVTSIHRAMTAWSPSWAEGLVRSLAVPLPHLSSCRMRGSHRLADRFICLLSNAVFHFSSRQPLSSYPAAFRRPPRLKSQPNRSRCSAPARTAIVSACWTS